MEEDESARADAKLAYVEVTAFSAVQISLEHDGRLQPTRFGRRHVCHIDRGA